MSFCHLCKICQIPKFLSYDLCKNIIDTIITFRNNNSITTCLKFFFLTNLVTSYFSCSARYLTQREIQYLCMPVYNSISFVHYSHIFCIIHITLIIFYEYNIIIVDIPGVTKVGYHSTSQFNLRKWKWLCLKVNHNSWLAKSDGHFSWIILSKGEGALKLSLCKVPSHVRPDHNIGDLPLHFMCGILNFPQSLWTLQGCETGPAVHSTYPRRLESLTICRWHYISSDLAITNPCLLLIQFNSIQF